MAALDHTPAEIVKHHEIDETSVVGILAITSSDENGIVPFVNDCSMVPSGNAIHHLILHMEKHVPDNLDIGVGRHAKVMAILITLITVEIALERIDAAHADFPRVKNPITYLGCKGEVEIIPTDAKAKVAAVNHSSLHVGEFVIPLCRSGANDAQKHHSNDRDDCKTFHSL